MIKVALIQNKKVISDTNQMKSLFILILKIPNCYNVFIQTRYLQNNYAAACCGKRAQTRVASNVASCEASSRVILT